MDSRFTHMPTYIIRDKAGNKLTYKALPLIAELDCVGKGRVDYKFETTAEVVSALAAINHTNMQQLPLGTLKPDTVIAPLANGKSPLTILCNAAPPSGVGR